MLEIDFTNHYCSALLGLLASARGCIVALVAYVSDPFISLLLDKALKGVKVYLITDDKRVRPIPKSVRNLHILKPVKPIHTKIYLVDCKYLLHGSANITDVEAKCYSLNNLQLRVYHSLEELKEDMFFQELCSHLSQYQQRICQQE